MGYLKGHITCIFSMLNRNNNNYPPDREHSPMTQAMRLSAADSREELVAVAAFLCVRTCAFLHQVWFFLQTEDTDLTSLITSFQVFDLPVPVTARTPEDIFLNSPSPKIISVSATEKFPFLSLLLFASCSQVDRTYLSRVTVTSSYGVHRTFMGGDACCQLTTD